MTTTEAIRLSMHACLDRALGVLPVHTMGREQVIRLYREARLAGLQPDAEARTDAQIAGALAVMRLLAEGDGHGGN